jgi:hypothetical protein
VDFAAVAEHLGDKSVAKALKSFDSLYPQKSGQSALQQLQAQLSSLTPYALKRVDLKNFKNLATRYSDFENIRMICADIAVNVFDLVCEIELNES